MKTNEKMSTNTGQLKNNENKTILSNGDVYIGNMINGMKNGN